MNHYSKKKVIAQLSKGEYFGEIGLLSNLSRTANVASLDYATVAELPRSSIDFIHANFPSIIDNMKKAMFQKYSENDQFRFIRYMVKNIPLF